MAELVGIRFKPCGKLYDFEADGMELKPGDMVVVESELGLSIGKVICKSRAAEGAGEYKKVMRRASEEDIRESKANAEIEKEAFAFCRERVMARGLQMKLIRTESTLDRKRIIFYFIAEKRIDFRELVKDLAQKFRTRIEMRQVGVRDEAKMTGGLGLCGRQLCCTSFLVDFAPISIKMAKKQELVLNTGKLSGICGRLMCCLSYEYGDKPCEEIREEEQAVECLADEVPEEEADAGGGRAPHTRTETANKGKYPERRHPEKGHHRAKAINEETGKESVKTEEAKAVIKTGPEFEGRDPGPRTPEPLENAEPGNGNPAQKRKRKRRWKKRGRPDGREGTSRNPGNSGD